MTCVFADWSDLPLRVPRGLWVGMLNGAVLAGALWVLLLRLGGVI